jgi:hypothetical protein
MTPALRVKSLKSLSFKIWVLAAIQVDFSLLDGTARRKFQPRFPT